MVQKVEAVQTVMPTKPTDPKQLLGVKVTSHNNLKLNTIMQRRYNVVLCYKKATNEDSGRLLAGWIKESLGTALVEQPLLAGRVRRISEEQSDHLHIVSNDSGVRLVEVSTDMNLDDFLTSQVDESSCDALVFSEDLRDQDHQFSPLFYVQVTNFSCGGYSIGISCSLLLADPFTLTAFLKRWTKLHNNIVSSSAKKIPIFYHPKTGKLNTLSSTLLTTSPSNASKAPPQTLVFQVPSSYVRDILNDNVYENLAALCIDEAKRMVGRKITSKFALFVVKPCEGVKVEICSIKGVSEKATNINIVSEILTFSNLFDDDELKLDKICFNEGNQAAYGSCWINSVTDGEDSVMIIIASDDLNSTSTMKILVTFT